MKIATVMAVAATLALAGCGDGGSGGGHEKTGAAQAPPEAQPEVPATGTVASDEAAEPDGNATIAAAADYIDSLDRHDAAAVCALFAPGALDLRELPRRRGGCRSSLRASIGLRPPHGAPAWQRTRLLAPRSAVLDDDRARVTATVRHRFSDRNYVSVEDDVIYLERIGGRWLLAKPSSTFYRAVGYPDPPLRSLSPPPDW